MTIIRIHIRKPDGLDDRPAIEVRGATPGTVVRIVDRVMGDVECPRCLAVVTDEEGEQNDGRCPVCGAALVCEECGVAYCDIAHTDMHENWCSEPDPEDPEWNDDGA